jgi:DNA polymerase III delta prime subunit
MREQLLWVEKYRPEKIQDCILPESIKSTFQEFVNKGTVPNLLISGSAGVGKTTIAKALCKEVDCDYIVINGSDENGIDVLRGKIKNYASSVSLSGGRKVVIIDEADYLNANSIQPALRNAIEEFAINCSFIFTCNYKNRIIEPLHSRCSNVDVKINKEDKQKLMAQFFKRVCWILEQENIEFNKEVVAQVVAKYFPDNRRVLNELQRYSMGGTIDAGLLSQVSDVNITPLVKGLKEKSFADVRKWLVDNLDNDSHTIYRKLYDNMYDILKPNSIPQLVMLIGEYQYKTAFVVDHEINLMAFFTQCMVDLEFK